MGLAQLLFGVEHGVRGQKRQPAQGAGGAAFFAVRIGKGVPQHLVAAAHTQHRGALRGQLEHRRFQPALTQPQQVVYGVFGAGQDHHIRRAQLAGALHIAHPQQRVLFQRHEVGEVGNVRQAQNGRIQWFDGPPCLQPGGKGILILNVHLQVGDDPQHRQLRFFFQHGKAGTQDLHVAPELVDEQPLDAGPLVRLQQGHRAVQLCKDAAPVDVSGQQHRGVHQLGKAHVHNVVGFQVDLGRAASSLNDDDVHLFGQTVVGGKDVRDQRPLHFKVGGGGHLPPHLAVHDHLTAGVAAGFEQDGVHAHVRFHPGGLRLHHLRPAHFQPVPGHKAVQGHVLALERSHPVAVLCKNAAQCGAQQAFACTAHGALHHNAGCFVHASTSARVFNSSSFSGPVRTAVRYQLPSSPG